MARGGYRPNSGRKLGTRNAATVEREMTASAERLADRGKKSDISAMLEIRDYWMAIAGREQTRHAAAMRAYEAAMAQPRQAGEKEPDEPKLDLELMSKALGHAGDMASKRAPFLHSRLSATVITQAPWDLTKLTDEELDALERLQRKAGSGSAASGAGATEH